MARWRVLRRVWLFALITVSCTDDPAAVGLDATPSLDASGADGQAHIDASASIDSGSSAAADSGAAIDAGGADASGSDATVADSGVGRLGGWQSRAPLSAPRQETAVVAYRGEIYVLGGFDAARRIVATVEAFDPSTDRWRTAAPLPVAMHHANAAVVDDRIYVAGFLVGLGFAADGRIFVYDGDADRWTDGGTVPRARGASGVAVIGGTMWLIGGQDGGTTVDQVSSFVPATATWATMPDLPNPRNHLVAGAIDGQIYIAGGRSGGLRGHTSVTLAFDPARVGDGWRVVAPMPTSRAGLMGAVLDGRLFVFGGEGNPSPGTAGVFAETESYDPMTDTWTSLALMRPGRHGTGAAASAGQVFVPGGADRQAFGAVATNEAFIPPPNSR